MRIHIGKISPALASSAKDLERLLDKYGTRESGIALHRKEYGDFYFGFVDMDLDAKQYALLRNKLNNIVFKQSKLEIKEAKPDLRYSALEESQSELPKPELNPTQLKRNLSYIKRDINEFKGRNLNTTKVREPQTFRVLIKKELRKPRLRKTKLWGIEKRPLAKLTNHFEDGEWRDGEDHAVEVVASMYNEHERDIKLAKQVDSGVYLSDSDFDEFKEHAVELENVYNENDDDGIQIVSKSENSRPELNYDEDEDDDAEEMEGVEMQTNSVETLKSAFSVNKPFRLFGAADEVEEGGIEAAPALPEIPIPELEPEAKHGLFFLHKSPYLKSQNQSAKLSAAVFESTAWEKEFFDKRSDYKGEIRKRRRDALRTAKRMGKKRGEI